MIHYTNGARVVCSSCHNTVTLDGEMYKGGVWRGHAEGCERSVESRPTKHEDPVNSPGHYTRLEPQPIEVIEKWQLPFHEAQVIKYISRAGHKDPSKHLEDLKKAEFYLKRKIAAMEAGDK